MSAVVFIGAGGLFAAAGLAVAASGAARELRVIDDDRVEPTNLHRQVLFGHADLGAPKAVAAAAFLEARFPVTVTPILERFVPERAAALLEGAAVVVEGSDNFPTKFLACDAARRAGIPIVHGSALRWVGAAFAAGAQGPCYRCLFEDVPSGGESCAEAGILGPIVGRVGAVQGALAVAALRGHDVAGTVFTLDGAPPGPPRERRRVLRRRAACPLCAGEIVDLARSRYEGEFCG